MSHREWFEVLVESSFKHIASISNIQKIKGYDLSTKIELFHLQPNVWCTIIRGRAELLFEHDAIRLLRQAEEVELHDSRPLTVRNI